MKRYFLFVFAPGAGIGGWSDFIMDFDSIKEAATYHQTAGYEVMQIVDTTTGTVIYCGQSGKFIF